MSVDLYGLSFESNDGSKVVVYHVKADFYNYIDKDTKFDEEAIMMENRELVYIFNFASEFYSYEANAEGWHHGRIAKSS